MDNGRCYGHGGTSTGAPLVHGRRSKFLPVRLLERYAELQDDVELVSLTEDLRVNEARIIDVLTELRDETGSSWQRARELFQTSMVGGKSAKQALVDLGKLLERGAAASDLEDKFDRLTDQRRKLSLAEARREALQESNMNAREANALVTALIAAVEEEVPDAGIRRAIRLKLIRHMSA